LGSIGIAGTPSFDSKLPIKNSPLDAFFRIVTCGFDLSFFQSSPAWSSLMPFATRRTRYISSWLSHECYQLYFRILTVNSQ
jgi:hypothetical protein